MKKTLDMISEQQLKDELCLKMWNTSYGAENMMDSEKRSVDIAYEYIAAYSSQPERVEGVESREDWNDIANGRDITQRKAEDILREYGCKNENDTIDRDDAVIAMIEYAAQFRPPAAPSAVDWDEVRDEIIDIVADGFNYDQNPINVTADNILTYLKNTLTAKD